VNDKTLQSHLLEAVATREQFAITALVGQVAKAHGAATQQAVAIALWALLESGELKLTRAGRVKMGVSKLAVVASADLSDQDSSLTARRNRRKNDELHADGDRTEARRDRDRVLNSWAFRRLEGVTQVVTPDHSGHLMHSRMTHSLKVSQVGRRISDRLLRSPDADLIARGGGLDPDVVDAAGLAHDMGHPPFGHAGETALNDLSLKLVRGGEGFEGNAQTLRILTRMEFRFNHIEGLNLTNATRAAVAKYPWARARNQAGQPDSNDRKSKKFNAYDADLSDLESARSALGVAGDAQTLEASIMDIADDITYALHDLEDFYTAGLFPRNQIAAILGDYGGLRKNKPVPATSSEYTDLVKLADNLRNDHPNRFDQAQFDDAVRKVRELVRFSMFRHFDSSRAGFALVRTAFASRADSYIREIVVTEGQSQSGVVAELSPNHWHEIEVLKWLMRRFVINRSELALAQKGQVRLLEETVHRLAEWCDVDEPSQLDKRLPRLLRECVEWSGYQEETRRSRGIIDYVASLTDAQLTSLARALSGAGVPSSSYFV
jgi:dGTPase